MPALTPRVVWLAVTLLSIALHADAQNDNGRDSVSSYGTDSTITGGYVNEASGDLTFVGGGTLNEASGNYATVAGGRENTGSSSYSSVLGGFENTASDSYAFIGGGESNSAEGQHATIGGGEDNLATGDWAALPGGKDNTAGGQYAHVGGGQTNTADGDWAAIGGGKTNRADGDYASIGGGKDHSASADYATVAGGEDNDCKATHCFVGGGKDNRNTATYATISGGRAQTAKATFASIGGGFSNTVQATGFESTISGGRLNVIAGEQSVIGGGVSNVLTAGATIAGIFAGEANTAKGRGAIIVGGQDNEAGPDATFAFVGGGSANRALSNYTVIGGGTGNTVDGAFYATIAGGRQNRVDAPYAFVGGGAWNSVHSPWSAALGKGANVSSLHESALVLAFDKSGSCASMGEETVSVCAPNGMYLNGRLLNFTSGVASGTVEGGNRVTLHPSNSLSGTNASIGGGIFNTATGEVATIGGGSSNYAIGRASVVAGGYANAAAGVASAVVGGSNNEASGFESVVGGGNFNTAVGTLATVAGGAANTATSAFAFIGGGSSNRILAPHSAVLGSNASVRLGHGSSLVLGFTGPTGGPCVSEDSESVSVCAPNGLWVNGELVRTGTDALYEPLIDPSNNRAATWTTIGGGRRNAAFNNISTVGGGAANTANGVGVTIGGGLDNFASLPMSAISGGKSNTANAIYSFIGGGFGNLVDGDNGFVGGGEANLVHGRHGSVGGGKGNTIAAGAAMGVIGGGQLNSVLASYSYIPGGVGNTVASEYSLALGNFASNQHDGSGVFSFTSDSNNVCLSQNEDALSICATNGVYINGEYLVIADWALAEDLAAEASRNDKLQSAVGALNTSSAEHEVWLATLNSSSAALQADSATLATQVSALDAQGRARTMVIEDLEGNFTLMQDALSNVSLMAHANEMAVGSVEADVSSLEAIVVAEASRNDKLQRAVEALNTSSAEHEVWLATLNSSSAALQADSATLATQVSALDAQGRARTMVIEDLEGNFSLMQESLSNVSLMAQANEMAVGSVEADVSSLDAIVVAEASRNDKLQNAVGALNTSSAEHEVWLATLNSSSAALQADSATLATQVSALDAQGRARTMVIEDLEGNFSLMQESLSNVSLMAQANEMAVGSVEADVSSLEAIVVAEASRNDKLQNAVGALNTSSAEHEVWLATLNSSSAALQADSATLATQVSALDAQGRARTMVIEDLEGNFSLMQESLSNVSLMAQANEMAVGSVEADVSSLEAIVVAEASRNDKLQNAVGALNTSSAEHEVWLATLNSSSAALQADSATLATQVSALDAQGRARTMVIEDLEGNFSLMQESLSNVSLMAQANEMAVGSVEADVSSLEAIVVAEASRNDKLQNAVGALNTSSAEHEVWLATLNSSSAALQADSATLATQVSALDAQGRARTMVIEDLEGNFSLMQESLSNVSLMAQANEMAVGSVEADVSSLDAIVVAEASRNDKLQNAVGALNTSSAEHEVWLTALNDTLRVQQEVDFQIRLNVSDLGNQLHQLDMLVRAMNSSTQAELVLNITEAVGQLSSEFFALSSNSTVLENRLSEVIQHATVLESQLIGTRVNVSQLFDVLVGLVHAHNSTATAVGMLDNNVTKQHWEIADLASTIMALAAKVQFDLPAQLEFHNQTLFRLAANASDQRFAISKVQAVVSGHSTRLSACEADLARSLNVTLDLEERLADAVRNSSVQALHIVELEHAAELQKANATWQEERINGLEGMVAVQSALIERLNTSLAQLDSIVSSMSTRASFVASTSAFDELTDMEVLTTMDAVDDTTHGPCNNNNIMPCELASTMSEADVAAANALAAFFARTGSNASAAEEVDAVSALLQFAENSAATSSDVSSTILAGIQNAAALLSSGGGSVNDETLTIFLDAVDGFAGWSGATGSADGITALDSALDSVCAAVSSSGSSSTTFQQETFSLSCGPANSTDTTVETDDVVVTIPGSTAGAVAVSSWSSDVVGSSDNSNVLVSNVIGVTVSGESSVS